MKIKHSILGAAVAAALTLGVAGTASAHTISLGSYNSGGFGNVTLVMGTYSHGSGFLQGAMQLIAGPGVLPAIASFSTFSSTKPAQLVDGTNNFYAIANSSNFGTLPSDSFTSPTDTTGIGPVTDWQSISFTGLQAGLYTYQLSGMDSANWTNVNSFAKNWQGTINITGATVAGVPEPTSLALAGLALFGLAALRRRPS